MKTRIISLTAIAAFVLLQSFTVNVPTLIETVSVTTSKVVWKGYKVSGSHEGTIDLKSGTLNFTDDKLSGGQFEIDMTSLTSTDLEGEYMNKLNGHLKSDDFFGVADHPTSTLVITEVTSVSKNAYEVTGDLTIKGITKPITFDASIYGNKATANLKVDRTIYNVKYGSGSFFDGLADNMIYDEMDLVIDLDF